MPGHAVVPGGLACTRRSAATASAARSPPRSAARRGAARPGRRTGARRGRGPPARGADVERRGRRRRSRPAAGAARSSTSTTAPAGRARSVPDLEHVAGTTSVPGDRRHVRRRARAGAAPRTRRTTAGRRPRSHVNGDSVDGARAGSPPPGNVPAPEIARPWRARSRARARHRRRLRAGRRATDARRHRSRPAMRTTRSRERRGSPRPPRRRGGGDLDVEVAAAEQAEQREADTRRARRP